MRNTDVRTFAGSRSSGVDTSFTDHGEDATGYGFPSISLYVANQTAVAEGNPPILNFEHHFNYSFVADGLIGGHLYGARFFDRNPRSMMPLVPTHARLKRAGV
jgi:hypothetical protein